jgi:hypothetical protein
MGYGVMPKTHFRNLRSLLPDLRGLTILDNDGRELKDSAEAGLEIFYWRRYEAENYFITPELLMAYTLSVYGQGGLFDNLVQTQARDVLNAIVLETIFGGDEADFNTWIGSPADSARLVWETKTERIKLSSFAEGYFRRLGETLQRPMLLRKGELHRLVKLVDVKNIPREVGQKLDSLNKLLVG